MGFLHAGQAGLELPTSGDQSTLASQNAEITGMSHWTQPAFSLVLKLYVKTLTKINKPTQFLPQRSQPDCSLKAEAKS